MTQWIGYNARKELPKSAANDSLERCLARRCLEWLLERCEAVDSGKRGGDSFEIEMSIGFAFHWARRTWQEGWGLI